MTAKGFKVSRITRTQAHQLGVMIYDANTREPIEPEQARAQALDKRAYDQNYECAFANENLTLLTHELISAAEREDAGFICEQEWGNPVVWPVGASDGAPSPQPSPPLGAREEESDSEQGAAFHPSTPSACARMLRRDELGEKVRASADEGEPFSETQMGTALRGAPSPQPSPPLGAREEESVSEQGAAFHPSTPLGEKVPARADEGEREESNVLEFLRRAVGPLYVGFDVARKGDLSVITVLEDLNGLRVVRAILRMRDLRLPEQQQRLEEICRLRKFHRAAIDMTGLGLGLFEYAQSQYGSSRIHGINFGSTVPATGALRVEGRRQETVRVTEAMAMELLQAYEDRRIQHPADPELREDLRKPERVTTAGGRVSIAATRDEAGHADHFWSLALALEAAGNGRHSSGYASGDHCGITVFKRPERKLWI